MTVVLHDPLGLAIQEIADPKCTRNTVALSYAFALRQNEKDFGPVNRAIIERWSFSGLEYINKRAWDIYEGKVTP